MPVSRKRATASKRSQASKARKAEALAEGADVEFDGETYTIPPYEEWDIDALEAMDDQRYTVAIRGIIGDDQYSTFRSRHSKIGELEAFLTKLMDVGDGKGNS
ncbi:MAG: hypothetical protein ACRDSK_13645 [Actinophytocola sp.]|uniref:hypothetical protein n=1 Tax=Actinophytocola sp. TaxID=1872138 RepID=UPI003D6B7C58